MFNKRRISLNVIFSLLQTIVIGVTYYFLYKFLLSRLGEERMGIWAVVLSMSSVANMANMGIGTSVVRLTAKFLVNSDTQSINRLVHTSLILLGSFFLLLSLIIYIVAPFWLEAIIELSYLSAAMSLVPYSLASLLVNAVSSVFLSCLDGFQKNFVRSIIYIFSSGLLLLLTFRFIPS